MEQLFKKMQNIVNKYVVAYKTDFDWDKKNILEMLDVNDDTVYERYLYWIVRKHGTNIGYKSNVPISATFSYYLGEPDIRYYEIDLEEKKVTFIKNPVVYKGQVEKEAA